FFKVGAVLVLIAMLTSGASLAVLTAAQHQARALPPGVEEGAPISGLLEATTVRPERIDGVLRLHKHPERALPVRVFTTPPHGSAPGSVLELLSAIARPGDPGDRAVLVARARTLDLLASPPPLL